MTHRNPTDAERQWAHRILVERETEQHSLKAVDKLGTTEAAADALGVPVAVVEAALADRERIVHERFAPSWTAVAAYLIDNSHGTGPRALVARIAADLVDETDQEDSPVRRTYGNREEAEAGLLKDAVEWVRKRVRRYDTDVEIPEQAIESGQGHIRIRLDRRKRDRQ